MPAWRYVSSWLRYHVDCDAFALTAARRRSKLSLRLAGGANGLLVRVLQMGHLFGIAAYGSILRRDQPDRLAG